jgi:uncharacterized iron-regulated membrane protein
MFVSKKSSIRSWAWIHKWSSLICTIFLLMLCLTGLPLIFHEEIDHLMGEPEAPAMPADTPRQSMDRIVDAALAYYPGQVIQFMSWDQEEHPHMIFVGMNKSLQAPPDTRQDLIYDDRTAKLLDAPKAREGFMYVMLQLHTDMFAGLPGKLFLGVMGLLFVIAIVSGVVLYSPFMRKLEFGTVRKTRSTRVKWLDLHNLLGIVALSWTMVVGLTGVINTLSDVVLMAWQGGQLAEMVAPYKKAAPLTTPGSAQNAVLVAEKAAPQMESSFIAFPGTVFTSKHHYAVFMKGNTPLTSRLLMPALVDAESGKLTDMREMPWYVQTLFLSQPLHFGDYGGLPLKILWALLDIVSIVILGSGVYLWLRRRRSESPVQEKKQISDLTSATTAIARTQ